MACGGNDPKKTKAVLDKVVDFFNRNLENTAIHLPMKEIQGEVGLKIIFELRAAISESNASAIEILKRDINNLNKSGKGDEKESTSAENLVADVVEISSDRSELLSIEDSAEQEIRCEAPKLPKFEKDKKKSERISVQNEINAVGEIMSVEQDVPKLAEVPMSDEQGSSNELKTVAEISLEKGEEIIAASNITPNLDGQLNEDAVEKEDAKVFIDCLIEYVLSEFALIWKNKDSAEKLPKESLEMFFSKVIGDILIGIIIKKKYKYTDSYEMLRERNVNTSNSFKEECSCLAASYFRKGYDHIRFLKYAAKLIGFSILQFENEDHFIADATAQVLSLVLNYYIEKQSFLYIANWFHSTLIALQTRKEMNVDAKQIFEETDSEETDSEEGQAEAGQAEAGQAEAGQAEEGQAEEGKAEEGKADVKQNA